MIGPTASWGIMEDGDMYPDPRRGLRPGAPDRREGPAALHRRLAE